MDITVIKMNLMVHVQDDEYIGKSSAKFEFKEIIPFERLCCLFELMYDDLKEKTPQYHSHVRFEINENGIISENSISVQDMLFMIKNSENPYLDILRLLFPNKTTKALDS